MFLAADETDIASWRAISAPHCHAECGPHTMPFVSRCVNAMYVTCVKAFVRAVPGEHFTLNFYKPITKNKLRSMISPVRSRDREGSAG